MQEEAVVRHRWTLDDVGTSITGWRWQRPGAGDGCGRQKRALKRKQEVRGREREAGEREDFECSSGVRDSAEHNTAVLRLRVSKRWPLRWR